MSVTPTADFFSHFAALPDPRIDRTKRHPLLDVVAIALCATLAGCNTWVEVAAFGRAKRRWFERFLELPHGIPSHDTFSRVFRLLDTGAFHACLLSWLRSLSLAVGGDVIAIDGKTLRGAVDRAAGQSPLHLVQAWSTKNRVVLGQVATDAHSNEITAIPPLLRMLDLLGATVTLDAMGCQKEIAAQIHAQGADYVMTLKGNQEGMHAAVQEVFEAYLADDGSGPKARVHQTREKSHGREETRTYHVLPVPATLPGKEQWTGLRSVALVVRARVVNGKESGEVRYYLSSLPPHVRKLAVAVRKHWGIENHLHWSLDVAFDEDKCRSRKDNAGETTGLLRRLALSLLQQDTLSKDSLRVRRKVAGWDEQALARLLTGFQGN